MENPGSIPGSGNFQYHTLYNHFYPQISNWYLASNEQKFDRGKFIMKTNPKRTLGPSPQMAKLLLKTSQSISNLLSHLEQSYKRHGIECTANNKLNRNRVMSIISPINFLPPKQLQQVMCLQEEPLEIPEVKVEPEPAPISIFVEQQQDSELNSKIENPSDQDSEDDEPEGEAEYREYLRAKLQKVNRPAQAAQPLKNRIKFGMEGAKKASSRYTRFCSVAFQYISEKNIRVSQRPAVILGRLWTEASRRSIEEGEFENFLREHIKKYIKSVPQVK